MNPASARIRRLLIANRGEIACRIMRTCRALGIETVAVCSDADRTSRHVRVADSVMALAGNTAGETYLRGEAIIEAALRSGADAIHPGYGFLSENAAFAASVIEAGLIWIGPPPAAIALMGSKSEAKALMRQAGVPVLPDTSTHDLGGIGHPMLLKAAAGGGGRGMRIVRSADEYPAALRSAQAEARASFGDDEVFAERYVERGRHIEVQVVADTHGTIRTLFERECSIQRRHQKIVEEAPSPFVDADLRERLCAAAITAAASVDYVGAGTVEFLVEADRRFWFLEMNTRLQVEHPVTELVSGLDLVALQIAIAEGHRLPDFPAEPCGHAIEVRLTAEDPGAGYLPSSGRFRTFEIERARDTQNPPDGVRIDSGVESGDDVSPYYDSMVAKVIAVGDDRARAVDRLELALRTARLHGPTTNLSQLRDILVHPAFLDGELHTGFLDEHPCVDRSEVSPAAIATAILALMYCSRPAQHGSAIAPGWRNLDGVRRAVHLRSTGAVQPVVVEYTPGSLSARRIGDPFSAEFTIEHSAGQFIYRTRVTELRVLAAPREAPRAIAVTLVEPDGRLVNVRARLADDGGRSGETTPLVIDIDEPSGSITLEIQARFPDSSALITAGSLVAPMPGAIRQVHVDDGAVVAAGQVLIWLEAMKMEHQIVAPCDGVVESVLVVEGEQVHTDQVLLVVIESDDQHDSTVTADNG